ncbi:mynd finger family protein [Colletotrichum plurivorum]|uniref:Mynd finger family protein n=1 Tax=Colletotrichum plurivorum TaxID=2175906 RepID=A0A8H6N7K2_9PEZI|nr:mynd finger family protein [Colletotrichum plurivorum]
MLTPTVVNSFSNFYAVGNTPAVNVARALPHGIDANLLLVGCGDVRNILYTAYNEAGLPARKLDITCNDWDEAILARNILLFSLLIDNNAPGYTPWKLYYDLYLEKSDLKLLSDQVKKLLAASESLKTWKASTYGKTLPFCDQATFDDVRAVWQTYDDAASSDDVQGQVASLKKNLKISMQTRKAVFGEDAQSYSGLRSAAPFGWGHHEEILESADIYWKVAANGPSGTVNIPNPLFAASLSKHRVLHYALDPIIGFHLANAFAPLAKLSPLKPDPKADKRKTVAAAKTEFREWAAACGVLLRAKRLVVRSVASEALVFCHTLQHFAATKETSAGWYRRQFDTRPLSLDPAEYGGKQAAPAIFDAIDTSNLADHLGTLNLLMSTLPLLTAQPWSSVFTETMLKKQDTMKEAFDSLLFGHGPTVSLLLGAASVEYWTNATTTSFFDEAIIDLSFNTNSSGPTSIHNRMTWKQSKFFSEVNATGPLKIDPEALGGVLFKLYLEIFSYENPMKLLSISRVSMDQMIRNTAYTTFHRGTMIALLRYLKSRLSVSDFDTTVRVFLEKTSFERSLMFTGNLRQDLSVQLHTQGLFSEQWLKRDIKPNRNLGGFDSWEDVPEVVAVNLVIPKEMLTRLWSGSDQSKIASPTVRASLVSGDDAEHKWHNFFDDIHLAFGTIKTSGDRNSSNFSITIERDTAGWAGNSPCIASFYVPAAALQVERKTSYVRLAVQESAQNVATFSKAIGQEMVIFQAKLGDESNVFITRYLPGQARYASTCAAAGTVAESPTQAKGETEAIFTADISEQQDKIATITGHLDFLSSKAKNLLTNKAPLVLKQESPFTINLVFGEEHVYPITFPNPVDGSAARTRIARKSAYVEVIVPLAKPYTEPRTQSALANFMYPVTLARKLSNTPVALNLPHINLDRLPIIDISEKNTALRLLQTQLSVQFSVPERHLRQEVQAARNTTAISSSVRLNFKESIFTMFMISMGIQGEQTGLFALNHEDGLGIHTYIMVSAARLDAPSGAVVLDAAALPMTYDTLEELKPFLLELQTLAAGVIKVNKEELDFWRSTLPSMAERARTWNHKASCDYAKAGTVPVSLEAGLPTLCSCGAGKLPDDFLNIPMWETAKKYATRVAISPAFAVPFVDNVIDREAWKRSGMDSLHPSNNLERCTSCGKTSSNDGGPLKKCTGCQKVKYCGPDCQKKDWKTHRNECKKR